MKFAKELEEQAVPEWRNKYLDYKQGKKKLKAVTRATRNSDAASVRDETNRPRSPFASLRDAPVYSFLQRGRQHAPQQQHKIGREPAALPPRRSRSEEGTRASPPLSQQGDNMADATLRARAVSERSPLVRGQAQQQQQKGRKVRYGSIIGSPPQDGSSPIMERLKLAPSLELPEPALEDQLGRQHDIAVETETQDSRARSTGHEGRSLSDLPTSTVADATLSGPPPTQIAQRNAHQVSRPTDAIVPSTATPLQQQPRHRNLFHRRLKHPQRKSLLMRRMFSVATAGSPGSDRRSERRQATDIALEAYREVDFRQAEFFFFLDRELQKIEAFYKEKEDAARERLGVLREQLHILRDRRIEEVLAGQAKRERNKRHRQRSEGGGRDSAAGHRQESTATSQTNGETTDAETKKTTAYRRAHPFKASVHMTRDAVDRYRTGHVGKTSKAMGDLGTPRGLTTQQRLENHKDYVRRRGAANDPPYRTAKRKLKIAMAEYYRGLELMKSYILLNRTGFRKITKKFDKTGTEPGAGKEYMSAEINNAHFVQSSIPEELLQEVEDLYARYFERGNRKIAVGKLRAKVAKPGFFYGSVLRTGLLVAAGLVLGLQGVVHGTLQLYPPSDRSSAEDYWPGKETQAAYLLQIYGGYFLMLLLVGLFCLDAAVFTRYRINYQFIFDFDARHTLDWMQLCELPAWFGFLFGLFLWLNFVVLAGDETMYIYWPVLLVGLSAILLLCPPPPFFYFRARAWFLTSHFRLLMAGLYPVEFRDFFLGDMYCSQTYAMGNIELFFCAYARHWSGVAQCNSGHSRLLGFFQTLPGIWRLLQCVRRYYDSGLWTHLANGLKYTATISQYLSLSLWRIAKPNHNLEALFIACATINSFYCIFWDLYYDWSMPMNIYHKPPLLRDQRGYRRQEWLYYVAIVVDPILRFNWIFYVIYAGNVQHSSLISFLISLSEVFRRALWVLFRVENEHSTNVGRYRAQRDPALPYEVSTRQPSSMPPENSQEQLIQDIAMHTDGPSIEPPEVAALRASGRDEEAGVSSASAAAAAAAGPAPPPSGSLRQRWIARRPSQASASPVYAALKRAGNVLLAAHAHDYERKAPGSDVGNKARESDDDDDDDEDDEYQDEVDR